MTIAPIALGSLVAASRAEAAPVQTITQSVSASTVGAAALGVPVQPQANAVSAADAVLSAATAAAVGRQGGLAPLMADLAAALHSNELPAAARTAIADVLRLQLPLDADIAAGDLARALDRSGIFLEAKLAAIAVDPSSGPLVPDLKSALLLLRHALSSAPVAPPLVNAAAALASAGARQPIRNGASEAARATKPSPPYRGGATTAQPAAPPTITVDAGGPDLLDQLARETDSALARQELLQIASIPHSERDGSSVEPRWLFEIPFSTGQGTAVAQFEIGRDARRSNDEERAPTWRARFSIQVNPIGPVHAQLALSGGQVNIAIWAERQAAAEQLGRDKASLAQALADIALAAEVSVHLGAPRQETPQGRFVDQSS